MHAPGRNWDGPPRIVTTVMYHYVRDIPDTNGRRFKGLRPEQFEGQLDYVTRHYNVCPLADVIAAARGELELPPRPCVLTFDDGLRDHYTEVFPRLVQRGLVGSFYPSAGPLTDGRVLDVHKIHLLLASGVSPSQLVREILTRVESEGAALALPTGEDLYGRLAVAGRFDPAEVMFVKRALQRELPRPLRTSILSDLFRRYITEDEVDLARQFYMSVAELRELAEGGMEIGGHGVQHDWMDNLSIEEINHVIDESLKFLGFVLGAPPMRWLMSFPYGSYTRAALEALAAAGCAAAVTDTPVLPDNLGPMLVLPRIDTNDLPFSADAPLSKWTQAVSA